MEQEAKQINWNKIQFIFNSSLTHIMMLQTADKLLADSKSTMSAYFKDLRRFLRFLYFMDFGNAKCSNTCGVTVVQNIQYFFRLYAEAHHCAPYLVVNREG
jgi:hypothetical protein